MGDIVVILSMIFQFIFIPVHTCSLCTGREVALRWMQQNEKSTLVVKQQTITRSNVDPDLRRHMASLDIMSKIVHYKELSRFASKSMQRVVYSNINQSLGVTRSRLKQSGETRSPGKITSHSRWSDQNFAQWLVRVVWHLVLKFLVQYVYENFMVVYGSL